MTLITMYSKQLRVKINCFLKNKTKTTKLLIWKVTPFVR